MTGKYKEAPAPWDECLFFLKLPYGTTTEVAPLGTESTDMFG